MNRIVLSLLTSFFLSFLIVLPVSAQDFSQVRADLSSRVELRSIRFEQALRSLSASEETKRALAFLYAYMPWPDAADYSLDYFKEQTESALRARRETTWGARVPDREWYHFVLPVRVNNENLDTFRTVCYDELLRRVKGLSMMEAVLEVNHWCHEYVTYKPSDSRTSSPLSTMKTATGRCGEESTFTVAALRAVGIPARQVYTPRWAHTDDNHAWVEAWVDGRWYFLGACEPEPVLNLGWFNQPASRGMLMHTKVFGRYDGPEDVISRTACYTEINVTANYAATARTSVTVTDEKGRAVPEATIDFKLYNYGELFTVQRAKADSWGRVAILTGLGSMVAWAATPDGRYGFTAFSAGKEKEVKVILNHRPGDRFVEELTLIPPRGGHNLPDVSPEAARENARRFAVEDSIRTAYVRTFPESAVTESFCVETGLPYQRVRPFVQKACGNYDALFRLLRAYPNASTLDLLATLSDKDLRDFDYKVLLAHREAVMPLSPNLKEAQRSFIYKYVYAPRIKNETLTAWREPLRSASREIGEMIKDNPAAFAAWIDREITNNSASNPLGYTLSPEKAFSLRYADLRNKGLLFVAACRSYGIPARIDEVTGKVEYLLPRDAQTYPTEESAPWRSIVFKEEAKSRSSSVASGKLRLDYTARRYMENPGYYYHFTLSRLNAGLPLLQNYSETDTRVSSFSEGVKVDAGDYLLTSGTRMADGTVLARLEVFPVKAEEVFSTTLVMREDKEGVQVIGGFNAENRYYDPGAGCRQSILSKTGRGYYVTGLIKANHEPTNHILHDIEKLREDLEAWGRPILLLFPSQEEYDRFQKNRAEFTNLPSTLSFGIDNEGTSAADLFESGLTQSRELPLIVIADTFNRVVFSSQGYTIGIGEQIKRTVGKIE